MQGNAWVCSHILAILDVTGVVSVRKMMSKLLVHQGPGRPRSSAPSLRKQFENTGTVSFLRDKPHLYLMQNIRRDVLGKFYVYLISIFREITKFTLSLSP